MEINIRIIIFAIMLAGFPLVIHAQDAREKSHSVNVVPFNEEGFQKYYVSWASSSGSDDGWQHDIYNQVISFTSDGEMSFNTNAQRYIGTGNDEAQEPVSVAIKPKNNTMVSVWEDGSCATVDIRGQIHKPDGTITKSNWIIAGGDESQHSPSVVHLDGMFLVSYTDEAPPAQTSMNKLKLLNDETGEDIKTMELSPREKDQWWAISTSNNKNFAFVGWGDGEQFYGSVIKVKADSVVKTASRFYISNIDQYYYSVAWLEHYSKFFVIAKVNNNSVACFVDTNGIRSEFTSLANVPITRETDLAIHWNNSKMEYEIIYTSGISDVAILAVQNNSIILEQVNQNVIENAIWPTTGIVCRFVFTNNGLDLWDSSRKILITHNDENTNNVIYHFIELENLTEVTKGNYNLRINKTRFYNAFPNPFNPTTILSFEIPKTTNVKLRIYNLQGKLIKEVLNGDYSKGQYKLQWNGRNSLNKEVSSGTYFVKLITENYSKTQKIIYQK